MPAREGFALNGPSASLDPRTHAVRADLADVRLAAYVFAPHYVAPVACRIAAPVSLRLSRDPASEEMTALAPGDVFEVLEYGGTLAWGLAPGAGLVGYIPAAALAPAS